MRTILSVLVLGMLFAVSVPNSSAQSSKSAVITANPYLGTPISPFDARVSPYSSQGAENPYTTGGGKIYAQDGTYLGRLNSNRYDPESVANPYGRYGSEYSSTSINNQYSAYGSAYSNQSARNPYATQPPVVRYTTPTYTAPTYTAPTYTVPRYVPTCYYNCK